MSATNYILDITLVLLVLIQIKERPLTTKAMIRPLVVLGVIVATYFNGFPTAGNDLVLIGALALIGGSIGVASGKTMIMRRGEHGEALARAGWASAFFWVLGMGSRFALLVWMNYGGKAAIASFSAHHSITSGQAWTVAFLSMAVCEVVGRTAVLAARRRQIESPLVPELA